MDYFFEDYHIRATSLLKSNAGLAHYTTATAALNIIDKKELWLRHLTLMNDFSEFSYGIDNVSHWARNNEKRLNSLSDKLLYVDFFRLLSFADEKYWAGIKINTFAISLSEHHIADTDRGRLSMWRGYGGLGGVAMVLKPDFVKMYDANSGVESLPARYWSFDEVSSYLDGMLLRMETLANNDHALTNAEVNNIKYQLFMLVCSLKHPAFHEEKEWRLVANTKRIGVGLLTETIENIRGIPQKILKFDISDHQKYNLLNVLDRVIIGPHPAGQEIAEALKAKLLACKSRADVVLSDIPFRTN